MWIAIVIIAVFLIGGIIFIIRGNETNGDACGATLIGSALCLIGMVGLMVVIDNRHPSPQPIDVYRGNTTLQITYQDSIPIDTTVVWKEEK